MRRLSPLSVCLVSAAFASASYCQTNPAVPAEPIPVPAGQTPGLPAYGQQSNPSATMPAPAVRQTAPSAMPAYASYGIPDEDKVRESLGGTYIPLDSWIYPEMTRLYSLGFANTMYLGMRPYTRQTLLHILAESEDEIRSSDNEEAQRIFAAVMKELKLEAPADATQRRGLVYGTDSAYTRLMGISGQTLRDSFHLGQTLVNDYGRPYEPGFNSLLGASTVGEYGRFSLYIRGEYQHAAAGTGYSPALASYLSYYYDAIPYSGYNASQIDIPAGQIGAQNPFRLVEATLSYHVLGHEISGGKSDAWLGPAQGGALAWSNNAENIYSFRINRVEPLHIPLMSRFLGPVRYDFFYGSLKGHTAPNHPWVHAEMFSFRPSSNFEFGFQRTVIFGGAGHEPVTLHTFLKGFFDISDTTTAEKLSRNDPGARFSDFNMSYRLPFLRKYVTFYVDSIVHDDVTPPSAPRRTSFRTGLYLAQIPGARKMDFRFEAMDTDPITSRSSAGSFNYFETIQLQGYTNKGFITGDWIGREAKGGQAWLTYHLSGSEWVQLELMNKKNDKDFAPGAPSATAQDPFGRLTGFNQYGGTTQNHLKASVVKRFHHDDVELNAWFQYEAWKAPAYMAGKQTDTTTAVQLTFFPVLKVKK